MPTTESDILYLGVLEHALRGGGRPRGGSRRKRAAPRRRGGRRRPAGGGAPAAPAAQGEDLDLLTQHFNHTGQIDHINMDPAQLTTHVIAPTVRTIVQTQFPHVEGHQLTDLLRKRGHAVPASLQEAKAQLQKFSETARGVRAGWHQGVYSTVETMVSTTHNPSLIMELFACIATVMDSYSQLSTEDASLVLPALLTCAAMLQPAAAERAAARWKEQPYAPQHLAEIDKLRSQIKDIQKSQTSAMAGGGAAQSPVDMSRHLLALNATIAQKQEQVNTYDKIAAETNGTAPTEGTGSAPPTSLSSSILQGAPLAAPAAAPAAAAPTAAPAAAPAAAAPTAAPTFSPAPAARRGAPAEKARARAMEKKVQQLNLSGGTARKAMKQATVVGRDLGGGGRAPVRLPGEGQDASRFHAGGAAESRSTDARDAQALGVFIQESRQH